MRLYFKEGHVKHIRMYDTGKDIEWSRSRPICAVHFSKGYFGKTSYSLFEKQTLSKPSVNSQWQHDFGEEDKWNQNY